MELKGLTLAEVRKSLRDGETTAVALAEQTLAHAQQENQKNGAYLSFSQERALEQARRVDALQARGEALPPLAGVPVAVKDVIVTRGLRSTCASRMLADYIPPYDATAVERLERAGAVIIGKTNCDEFAMGSSSENSAFYPVRNPRDLERVPGGSSGGSAAAVAADTCVVALGSDTGGSIRQPASFCGVVGLMGTYGRVSRYGLTAFASSLDHIGPFGKTVRDVAAVLGVIAGRDPQDSTSADVPVPDYLAELERPEASDLRGFRVGVPREYFAAGLDTEVGDRLQQGIERLRALGAEIREIHLPHTDYAIACYYIILHGRGQLQPGPLRRRALRLPLGPQRLHLAGGLLPGHSQRGVWDRSEAAHHARHLRAQYRLLRGLLPESPKGASAGGPRLHGGVPRGGRDCHPHRAHPCVSPGREG